MDMDKRETSKHEGHGTLQQNKQRNDRTRREQPGTSQYMACVLPHRAATAVACATLFASCAPIVLCDVDGDAVAVVIMFVLDVDARRVMGASGVDLEGREEGTREERDDCNAFS